MTAAAYLVLLERWIAAWVQDRLGPNRVGIPLTKIKLFGLGQPLADGLKFIFKEEYTPAHVDKCSVHPGADHDPGRGAGDLRRDSVRQRAAAARHRRASPDPIELVVAPGIDVGMIYVFALSSIAVYGVILGGWASNNKYSFLGGLRSQCPVDRLRDSAGAGHSGRGARLPARCGWTTIIDEQAESGVWNVFTQPLGFVVFLVASFAEAARLPFDLPECEQELIGGYHTEYAGMKLLLFLIAEFLHMVVAAFLIVILFFGGWHFWGLTGAGDDGHLARRRSCGSWCSSAKVMGVILFFMMVRWSWPRFRFDQLMALAWKVMLPLGLVNLVAVAVVAEYRSVAAGTARRPASALVAGRLGRAARRLDDRRRCRLRCTTDNRPRLDRARVRHRTSMLDSQDSWKSHAMKPNDPAIKWIEEPKLGLAGKMYLPLFVQGLTTTARHLFSPKVTVSFPEVRPKIGNPLIYRGVHRLEQGRAGPREVRGLLPVRHGLPGPLHRHRRRRKPLARPREVSRELHDRRAALHLLRHVRRGLPGRRDRADQLVRPDRPQPRRDDLRQGKAAQRLRPDEGRRADEVARAGRHAMNADARRDLGLATRAGWPLGMWLLLPRGGARGRRLGALLAAGRPGAVRLRSAARLGRAGSATVVFCMLAAVTVIGRRGHGHVSQPGLFAPSGSRCRCWAPPGCSCFRGRSSWAWPRSWSMPARSWSRSCSC